MSDAPIFTVRPTLRCHARHEHGRRAICGARAVAIRFPARGDEPEFFCGEHARPTDAPIPANLTFRRVKVTAEIYLAGASLNAAQAEAEAVDRIHDALRQAGAVVSLAACSSQVGHFRSPDAARRAPGEPGKG